MAKDTDVLRRHTEIKQYAAICAFLVIRCAAIDVTCAKKNPIPRSLFPTQSGQGRMEMKAEREGGSPILKSGTGKMLSDPGSVLSSEADPDP